MNFNGCLSVRCSAHTLFISLFFCSIFFVSPNNALDDKLADLKVACGLSYKDKMDVTLKTVPCQCTSVILKCSDFTEDTFKKMFDDTPCVPLFLISDDDSYKDWLSFFQTNPLDVDKYIQKIETYCLAGLIFDNLYPLQEADNPNDEISKGIQDLFKGIRDYYSKNNRDIILGLVLPLDLKLVQHAFKFCDLENTVDVFLWSTWKTPVDTKCKTCTSMYSANEICTASEKFREPEFKCVASSKVVMEVNLFVLDDKNNQLSYGESCGLCSGTAVSLIPLKTMQDMGQLVYDKKFAGGYLRFVNDDDIFGICCCILSPQFPGLSAFISGMLNEDKCWSCLSFGVPGIHVQKNAKCPCCTTYGDPNSKQPNNCPCLYNERGSEVCQRPTLTKCTAKP